MWKTRPVLIISYRNRLNGPCTVLPISTDSQEGASADWAHPLSIQIERGRQSWVVCNQPYTVSPSRLSQIKGRVPRIDEREFELVLRKLLEWLPIPLNNDRAERPTLQSQSWFQGRLSPYREHLRRTSKCVRRPQGSDSRRRKVSVAERGAAKLPFLLWDCG